MPEQDQRDGRVPMVVVTNGQDPALKCDECWEPVASAALLAAAPNWAETGNARICESCLRKALAILEKKQE